MLFKAGKLLQPYCNQAGTGAYAVDKPTLPNLQNPWKMTEFADGLAQIRTYHFRLLISRFQVRVLGGSLPERPANSGKTTETQEGIRGVCAAMKTRNHERTGGYRIQSSLVRLRVSLRSLRAASYPAIQLFEDRVAILVALLVVAHHPEFFCREPTKASGDLVHG